MADIVPNGRQQKGKDIHRSEDAAYGASLFYLGSSSPLSRKCRVCQGSEGRGQPKLDEEGVAGLCYVDSMEEVVVCVTRVVRRSE